MYVTFWYNLLDNRSNTCSVVGINILLSKMVELIYNPTNNVTEVYLLHIFGQKLILLDLLITDILLMFIDIVLHFKCHFLIIK